MTPRKAASRARAGDRIPLRFAPDLLRYLEARAEVEIRSTSNMIVFAAEQLRRKDLQIPKTWWKQYEIDRTCETEDIPVSMPGPLKEYLNTRRLNEVLSINGMVVYACELYRKANPVAK